MTLSEHDSWSQVLGEVLGKGSPVLLGQQLGRVHAASKNGPGDGVRK